MCETDLGFALSELQSADVLQSGSVFIHLFADDHLHAAEAQIHSDKYRIRITHNKYAKTVDVLRCGLANVLYTLERVNGVRTPQDTGSKHNGQSISTHPVSLLLQRDPEKHVYVKGRIFSPHLLLDLQDAE